MSTQHQSELTVRHLVRSPELALTVLAGTKGLDRPVRWTHMSELEDPVPWMLGSELVLTTGLGIPSDDVGQRTYVRRLADASAAGLGIALGHHDEIPDVPSTVLAEAERNRFPILLVSEPTRFVEISQTVARRLSATQLRRLRTTLDGQQRIAQTAARDGAAGVVTGLTKVTGAQAVVVDPAGKLLLSSSAVAEKLLDNVTDLLASIRPTGWFASSSHDGNRHLVLHPIGLGTDHLGYLAAAVSPEITGDDLGLLIGHAASLLAIELSAKRTAQRDAATLRGSVLDALIRGAVPATATGTLLSSCGLDVMDEVGVSVWSTPAGPDTLEPILETVLDIELSSVNTARCRLADGIAVIAPVGTDWEPLSHLTRNQLDAELGVGVTEAPAAELSHAVHAAAIAAARARVTDSGCSDVHDVGGIATLSHELSTTTTQSLTHTVLAPIIQYDARNGTHLQASLRGYLEACGHWNRAAHRLGIHRNTLRHRLRRVERLTRRSLDNPTDRLDLWLALRLAHCAPGSVRYRAGSPG